MKKFFWLMGIIGLLLAACSGEVAEVQPTLDPSCQVEVVKADVSLKPGEQIEIQTPTRVVEGNPIFEAVYLKTAELVQTTEPSPVVVRLTGSLPSPCHKLYIKLGEVDKDNNILIKAFGLVHLPNTCLQKLVPFDQTVRIDNLPPGTYGIWVSSGKIAEVTIP